MTTDVPIGDNPAWLLYSGRIRGGESLDFRYKFPNEPIEWNPWESGSCASNQHPETYSVLDYSSERLIDMARQMEWTEYEVDPAWRNFCEFTHKDIGGPFEKLGIIRRKPKIKAMFVSPDMMRQIEKASAAVSERLENEILYGQPRSVFGVPVYESRYLPSRTIIEQRDV